MNKDRIGSPLANARLEKQPLSTLDKASHTLANRQKFDKHSVLNNQSPRTPDRTPEKIITNPNTSGVLDKTPVTPDKTQLLTNQRLEKQSVFPDKTAPVTNQMVDKHSVSSDSRFRLSDKQQLSPNQSPVKPLDNQSLSPQQRPEKQSLLAHKKAGTIAIDKQYRLNSPSQDVSDKVPSSPKSKPSLLPLQRSSGIDKQYRLTSADAVSCDKSPVRPTLQSIPNTPEHTNMLNQTSPTDKQKETEDSSLPSQRQPFELKSGTNSVQSVSSQVRPSNTVHSTPEQVISLNLSQKAATPSSQLLNTSPSSQQQHSNRKSQQMANSTNTALTTKSHLETKSNSSVTSGVKSTAVSTSTDLSCNVKSSHIVSKSFDSKSSPALSNTAVTKSLDTPHNRPSQPLSEVPITLSNTYQTILDSQLNRLQPPSTATAKTDSKSSNVQKTSDCDKTILSQERAKTVEEDNNFIANYVKEKTESAEKSSKPGDTKESCTRETSSNKKNPPERQIVKAFEDKYEPKSSPTKNIRKYSNLGKKSSNPSSKQDRSFTKSLRTKKDTNYLEDFSSTDTSGDDLVSKTSSKSTTKKRKPNTGSVSTKETPERSVNDPVNDESSESDVDELIEKIRKDERKKSKREIQSDKKDAETASTTSKETTKTSAKSEPKKTKESIAKPVKGKPTKSNETTKEEKCKDDKKDIQDAAGSRRLRNKQSVLYNLESLETDSDTTEDEIVATKGKKRKSKKSTGSENESDDKETKTGSKKIKTESKECDQIKRKRGRKSKQKEESENESNQVDNKKQAKNKTEQAEDEAKETSESESEDVKRKKTLKKRSRKANGQNKQVEETSDSEVEEKANKKGTRKKSEDVAAKKEEVLNTEECGTRKNLRRKPCHLYAENLSDDSEDDLELLIQNRSDEIETQNLMNHPRKSKKLLDEILAKTKAEANKAKAKEIKSETKTSKTDEESSDEDDEEEDSQSKQSKDNKNKRNDKTDKANVKKSSTSTKNKSEDSEVESEQSSRKQPKTPKKDAKTRSKRDEKVQEKTGSPQVEDKSGCTDDPRARRASRTQSLMIDTSSDDSEDDPLLAIAKTISRNEVRMSRRSIDLLHAKEKEKEKRNETSDEEETETESEEEKKTNKKRQNEKKIAQKQNEDKKRQNEENVIKEKPKDITNVKSEIVKPIAVSAKTCSSQCSSLDVSNKISSLIEKDKLKRGLTTTNEKQEQSVTSQQLQQEALQRLEGEGEASKRPFTPEKTPMSREQLHSSWKSAFQNLKLPKTSPSVSKKPMDRNAWIRKHAVLNKPKLGELGKNNNPNFEPFKINYSRSSSPLSLSSQNSDHVTHTQDKVEGKHHNLPMPVEQTLKRMANISPKVNKSFHFERVEPKNAPVSETKAPLTTAIPLTTGKIEDIPKAGNTNDQIMKWLNDSIPNDDSSCDDTNSISKKLTGYCDDTDTSVTSSVIDKGIVSAPVQLKDIFNSPSFASEKISSVKVDDYKRLKQKISRSAEKKELFTSPSLDRKRLEETTPEKKKHLESETDSLVSDLSSCDERPEKKAIFQQRRSLAVRLKERQTESTLAKKAFSPQNESSVYAFEPEPVDTSPSTPFRRSKTNTTPSPNSSIAVQVNFETETVLECSTTQTEGEGGEGEGGEDGHLFYIPLQKTGKDTSAIQGVAVKLGTEGPDQRVIMSAKLVTKPPEQSDFAKPSSVSCLVPQRRVRPFNTPIVGTVQPMSRPSSSTQVSPRSTHTQTPPPLNKSTPPAPPSSCSSTRSSVTSTSTTASKSTGKKSKSKSSQSTAATGGDAKKQKQAARPSPSTPSSQSPSPLPSTSSTPSPSPTPAKQFPAKGSRALMVEAPTFYPTEKEFQDPFEYLEKIRPAAEQFGICRIVPPSSFKPECKLNDDMRFTAYNQYVHKMLHRWGPNVKEMVAIRKYLATQSVSMQQLPLIGGIEVDLPRLYSTVQQCGGLSEVIEKKRWPRVADLMKIPRLAQDRLTKLDDIYCKYLLPYDTLSHDERSKLFDAVEAEWGTHFNANIEEDEDEEEEEEENLDALLEECIVKGRSMPLSAFYRVARNTMAMYFKSDNPNDPGSNPSPTEVETEFWNHVTERMLHVCVHAASIDTGSNGCGFPTAKNSNISKHPWNLKVLTNNPASILRSLNSLVGVTVPTLHVGMLFSACCWYRDPHGLPWIEYLHSGASKIWYGIPDEHSTAFRSTMMSLFPQYCRSERTIWLSSDVAMVPPSLLTEKGVSLSRVVQDPGQFVLVFPSAFTSSIATGYLVAESVYFARPSWLDQCERVFKDMQDSGEPSEFSLEVLLFSIASDPKTNIEVLNKVLPMLESIRDTEITYRSQLSELGLKGKEKIGKESGKKGPGGRKKTVQTEEEEEHECDTCRAQLTVSMVQNSEEDVDYCLKHGIEFLSQNLDQLKFCKFLYYYDETELEDIIGKLKDKIKTKSLKKMSVT
uniref:Protein Jumonji n=1 Tax=Cacopsylla melanoneura TaxID=428564 RepID=A0A8D8YBL7_9HEMI